MRGGAGGALHCSFSFPGFAYTIVKNAIYSGDSKRIPLKLEDNKQELDMYVVVLFCVILGGKCPTHPPTLYRLINGIYSAVNDCDRPSILVQKAAPPPVITSGTLETSVYIPGNR